MNFSQTFVDSQFNINKDNYNSITKEFTYSIRTIGIPKKDGEFIILNNNILRIIDLNHFNYN